MGPNEKKSTLGESLCRCFYGKKLDKDTYIPDEGLTKLKTKKGTPSKVFQQEKENSDNSIEVTNTLSIMNNDHNAR